MDTTTTLGAMRRFSPFPPRLTRPVMEEGSAQAVSASQATSTDTSMR